MEKDYDSDDGNVRRCNRQGVLLRILVAAFAIITVFLIILAIVLILTQKPIDLSAGNNGNESSTESLENDENLNEEYLKLKYNYRRFTFDQLFSGKLFLKDGYEFSWLNDGSLIRKKDEFLETSSDALRFKPNEMESDVFLDDFDLATTLSPDHKYAYRSKTIRHGFRHSSEQTYEIVKIENNTASKVSWSVGPVPNATIQTFSWNPKGHDFVYVHKFNVYYQADPEKPEDAVQLTSDGNYSYRYGTANWLYEEEILSSGNAIWFSPSGRYVSYLRFDDRQVSRIFLPSYVDDDSYVEYFEIPYPKAGVAHNTLVTQFIWDRDNNKIVEAVAPDELRAINDSYYIFNNQWMTLPTKLHDLGTERLITTWTNREQNHVYYTICNENDCISTFSQKFSMHGRNLWAEPTEAGITKPTKTGFFTILPHFYEKDNNIYNHVVHIEIDSSGVGKPTKWIGENFDVTEIHEYDQEKDVITFGGFGADIGERNIYAARKATNPKVEESISQLNALLENCSNAKYSVDPTGKRLTVQCQTPFKNTRLYLMNVEKPRSNVLLDGGEEAHLPFDAPNFELGKFKLSSGIEGYYSIMTPPKFMAGRKLPLIMDLYGGPNSRKVQRATPSAHYIQMSSQYEAVIVNVDVRGTSGRGWDVKESVYMNLGQPEATDTLEMLQKLIEKYSFIDADRVGVIGWSYGGFLSGQIAVKDQGETVRCAVSIAPVTNFRYYDSAYTERYMRLPKENPNGYDRTDLIPHARNITNVKYFLAHGERDDNVHYQNSARWSEALQIQNIHFKQLVYANEDHSIQGKTPHLYSEIQSFFFDDCFKQPLYNF